MTLVPVQDILNYRVSDSIVKLDINYSYFKGFRVSRSIDDVCGEFYIIITNSTVTKVPVIRAGDVIDIQIEGNQIMRGKVYEVSIQGDATSSDIVLSGRDITGDIIDSTVPDDSKVFVEEVDIFDIAGKVINSLGLSSSIGISNPSGKPIKPFEASEIIVCKVGEKAVKFLHDYCRKRQIFLNTDEWGNLVFFKPLGIKSGNRLLNQKHNNNNNIISYSVKHSICDRYFLYTCKTQSSSGWKNRGISNVGTEGSALDPAISSSRQYEFLLEEGGDDTEAGDRAIEECNVRRARAFEYTVVVTGFRDVNFWRVGQLVDVQDDKAGVHGEFFIKSVEYSLSNDTGRTTKLDIVTGDAYKAEAAISLRESKKGSSGRWFNSSAKDKKKKKAD